MKNLGGRKPESTELLSAASERETAPRRPEIVVEFLFDSGMLFIAVRNIGERPATKVAVTFDKPIIGLGGAKEISALALFKNIEFLGPEREIITLLDTSGSYFRRKQPTKISARISYLDLERRKYETIIKHDLEIYRELSYITSPATNKSDSQCHS